MRFFVMLLLSSSALLSCSTSQKAPKRTETIQFTRYFMTTVCDAKNNCIGPTVKDLEKSQVILDLMPVHKGTLHGVSASDESQLIESELPFSSVIRVTFDDAKKEYHVYMMLRSGSSTKREGVVKTFNLKEWTDLKQVVLSDSPFKLKDKTIKIELVLDSAVLITR